MNSFSLIQPLDAKRVNTLKRVLFVFAILAFFAIDTYAGGGGTNYASEGMKNLNEAGESSKTVVVKTVQNWRWLFALLPFAVGILISLRIKNYLDQKDEQSGGQSEPKVTRYGKMVLGLIGGIVIMFILYGVFGSVFAGQDFMHMWDYFVMDFWKEVLQGSNT